MGKKQTKQNKTKKLTFESTSFDSSREGKSYRFCVPEALDVFGCILLEEMTDKRTVVISLIISLPVSPTPLSVLLLLSMEDGGAVGRGEWKCVAGRIKHVTSINLIYYLPQPLKSSPHFAVEKYRALETLKNWTNFKHSFSIRIRI